MIEVMVVVFFPLEVDATLGVRFENTCVVLGNEMSPGLFQDFL